MKTISKLFWFIIIVATIYIGYTFSGSHNDQKVSQQSPVQNNNQQNNSTPPINPQQNNQPGQPVSVNDLKNASLSYPGEENNAIDNFTLKNGEALLNTATGPRGYSISAGNLLSSYTIGDLNSDGVADGAIALYRSWGANRILPIVFAVEKKNNIVSQIAYVVPDESAYNYETEIKSVSIKNEILTVNLLVLADADKNLPHYEQTPTVSKTVQFKLSGNAFVPVSK